MCDVCMYALCMISLLVFVKLTLIISSFPSLGLSPYSLDNYVVMLYCIGIYSFFCELVNGDSSLL